MGRILATRRPVAITVASILLLVVLLGAATACVTVFGEGGTPQVTTDKADYAPFETAIITGTGFEPYALLDIPVIRPDGTIVKGNGIEEDGWDSVQADEFGNFVYYYIVGGLEGTYTVEVYPWPWGGPRILPAARTSPSGTSPRSRQWQPTMAPSWSGRILRTRT